MDSPIEIKCDHKWKPYGLWDGKTPDGKRTGGQMYKCAICNDKASSLIQISQKGGVLEEEGLNIYGHPVAKK